MQHVVKQRDEGSRYVSVLCPLDCGVRISRTALAWQQHMVASHSAVAGTWTDTGIRGGQEGPADGLPGVIRFAQRCYGCDASFQTKALLVAHLLAVHTAS